MKSVIKVMNQPLRAIPQKTAVHKKITWETPTKEPTPFKMADKVPTAPLEIDPTTGIPQVHIK